MRIFKELRTGERPKGLVPCPGEPIDMRGFERCEWKFYALGKRRFARCVPPAEKLTFNPTFNPPEPGRFSDLAKSAEKDDLAYRRKRPRWMEILPETCRRPRSLI